MKRSIVYGMVLALAFALVAPVGASLVGTAFGYPTIVQTGSTTAFNQDTAAATDNEAFALAFPNTGTSIIDGSPTTGGFGMGFPTIAQTSEQTQVLTHTDFAQTNETAAFSYPYVGVGGVSIPGFGFGF